MKKFKNIKLMLLGLLAMGSVNAFADPRYEAADSLVYAIDDSKDYVTFYGIAEAAIAEFSGNIVIPATVKLHSTVGTLQEFRVGGLGRDSWTTADNTSHTGKLDDDKIKSITIECRLDGGVTLDKEGYGWEKLVNNGGVWSSWTNFEKIVVKDAHGIANIAALTTKSLKYIDFSGISNDGRGIVFADDFATSNTNLETMIFPSSTSDPVKIGANAFNGCTSLATITLGGKEITIGDNAFESVLGGKDDEGNWKVSKITGIDNVVAIGKEAFKNSYFNNYTIGKNVKEIGADAFAYSWSAKLNKGTIAFNSEKMTEVPAVFAGQTAITGLSISSPSVKEIAKGAFADQTALTSIDFSKATALNKVDATEFASLTSLVSVNLEGSDLDNVAGIVPTNSAASLTTFKFPAKFNQVVPSFKDCVLLTEIAIPAGAKGITSFQNCIKLATIDLSGTTITKIPANAFDMTLQKDGTTANTKDDNGRAIAKVNGITRYNTVLAEVKLPATITSIEASAFAGCSKLATINLSDLTKLNASGIGANAFEYTIIPSVDLSKATAAVDANGKPVFVSIPASAFANNTALKSVTLPAQITSIDANAFQFGGTYGKGLLAEINLDELTVLANLGENAFDGAAFKDLDLTANTKLKKISKYAFANNANLESVALPKQVEDIEIGAFNKAKKLSDINLNQTNIKVLNPIFTYKSDKDGEWSLDNLTSIDLNKDTSIKIGSSPLNDLEEIKEYAFQFTGLTEVVIPESVTKFGTDADNLKADYKTTEPEDNGGVFRACVDLTKFTWENAQVPTFADDTFRGDVKLDSVIFLSVCSTDELKAVKDREVFFMCNDTKVILTQDHYNITKAAGYDNDNREFSKLDVKGNVQFAFSPKGLASDGYYYATYKNLTNSSWFKTSEFDVFAAVVEGSKVVLKKATADGDYYKVAALDAGTNDAQAICVVRSKDIKAVPQLNSNVGSDKLSTLDKANGLTYVKTDGAAKGSKLNYIFKLANKGGNVAFYRVTSGEFKAGQIYIEAKISGARMNIVVEGEGEITGIENIFGAEVEDNAPVYNMQGVRVNAAQKGIYIKNGKKFIVK